MLLSSSILTLLVPTLLSLEWTLATPVPSVPESNCTTNAECLREGKPLLKPHARSKTSGLHPRQSGTSGTNPTSYAGYIKVADEINGGGYTTIGYLGFAEGAAAGVFSSLADAIPIEFPADLATGSGILINSNLMISPTSPLAAQYGSYLGANGPFGTVAGSEGYIGMTSTLYAGLLQPVKAAVPYGAGSVAAADSQYPNSSDGNGVETAIWNVNPTYGDLRLSWTDGMGGFSGIQPWYTTDGTPADFGLGSKSGSAIAYRTIVHC